LAEQLRRDLLTGARRLGMGGDNLALSNTDEDAVDLVGMLFDVLLDERHFEADVRTKINRLLVPYIKVAVKDRRLFLYKAHPARRLLNVVAEASEGNRGESPQERELMARVDGTIDRLVAEFNEGRRHLRDAGAGAAFLHGAAPQAHRSHRATCRGSPARQGAA
jgi:hypothetical protein